MRLVNDTLRDGKSMLLLKDDTLSFPTDKDTRFTRDTTVGSMGSFPRETLSIKLE